MSRDRSDPGYLRFLKKLNPLLIRLLRSPRTAWLVPSGFLLLEVTGRRSGRSYVFPVWHGRAGDSILVFVRDPETRTWWRNFREPHAAHAVIRGRRIPVDGVRVPPGTPEFRQRVEQYFQHSAITRPVFGVALGPDGGVEEHDLERLGNAAVVVAFEPA